MLRAAAPANCLYTSWPMPVPMVWIWLDSVLMAAASRVSRKSTPNQRGRALVT